MFAGVAHMQHHVPSPYFTQSSQRWQALDPPTFSPSHERPFGTDRPTFESRNRWSFQRPQQYTYSTDSQTRLNTSKALQTQMLETDTSEHMLRRKTPNGTLAAGYDGSRPPAAKHIAMPHPTTSDRSTRHGGLSSDAPVFYQKQQYSKSQQSPSRVFGVQGDDGFAFQSKLDSQWNSLGGDVDSVLIQGPPYRQHRDSLNMQHIPTPLQPCLGPQHLKTPLPIEPLWPDVACVPAGNPSQSVLQAQPYQPPNNILDNTFYRSTSSKDESQLDTFNSDNQPTELQTNSAIPLAFRSKRMPLDQNLRVLGYENSVQTPRPDSSSTFSNPPEKFQMPKEKSHFNKKVLDWAARVYENLLASITQQTYASRQSRSITNQKSGQEPSEVTLKQPHSIHESRNWGPGTLAPQGTGSTQNGQSDRRSHLFEPQRTTSRGFNQSNTDRPSRPSRHSSEAHYYTASKSQFHGASSRTDAAAAAIEMLGQLCQQDGWASQDAIMLGGKLSHGLGEFYRAMKWYSKALNRDPRYCPLSHTLERFLNSTQ